TELPHPAVASAEFKKDLRDSSDTEVESSGPSPATALPKEVHIAIGGSNSTPTITITQGETRTRFLNRPASHPRTRGAPRVELLPL
ncbi:hypothetical protein AVEN_22523-1, partial [Araneus ventricosus]